jgi:myo-inositol catabolism protein IolH
MHSAFDTSLLRNLSLDNALQEISKTGFSYIETGLAHFSVADSSEEEASLLKQSLAKYGLHLAALCGIYYVSYPGEEVRAHAVEQFKRAIERARKLDCDLFVSELNGDLDKREESTKAFQKSMSELVPHLEKTGVTLCFEAHPGDFVELNKNAVELIRSIGSKHLRYLYCTPHTFVLGNDIGEMIDECKDILGYVHVADSLRPEKTFFSGRYFPKVRPHQHLLPGLGDVDFRKIIISLRKADYSGFLTSNPFSHFDRPLEALRESKMKMDFLLQSGESA